MDTILHYLVGVLSMSLVGVIGWAFNITSRLSVQESRHEDLKELIEVKSDAISDRLERIERALNGALKGH